MLQTVSRSISGDEFGFNFIKEGHHLIEYLMVKNL